MCSYPVVVAGANTGKHVALLFSAPLAFFYQPINGLGLWGPPLYCALLWIPIATLEIPLLPKFILEYLLFWWDIFFIRSIVYVIVSLPLFLNWASVFAGLLLWVQAFLYLICSINLEFGPYAVPPCLRKYITLPRDKKKGEGAKSSAPKEKAEKAEKPSKKQEKEDAQESDSPFATPTGSPSMNMNQLTKQKARRSISFASAGRVASAAKAFSVAGKAPARPAPKPAAADPRGL
jgi:hypothetical protein